MKSMSLSVCVVVSLSIAGCAVTDVPEPASDSEEDVAEVGQALCSNTDLDQGASCRIVDGVNYCDETILGYANEYGWTRGWWPSSIQNHCEPGSNQWRLYWNQPYVRNPAYEGTIRLRYQGPDPDCDQSPYEADYLTKDGVNYLRVVFLKNPGGLGPCQGSDYVMVAP